MKKSETMAAEHGWKKALQEWGIRKGITPTVFAQKTGYSYQHAFNLLRGNTAVSSQTLGHILMGFGPEVAGELMALAGSASPCSE